MAPGRRLLLTTVLSLVVLFAAPRPGLAQFGMEVSTWMDAWSDQEYTMLHTIASGVDSSWGCNHWDYSGVLFVNGPNSGYTSGPGLWLGLSLPNYDGGNYEIEVGFLFYCDCVGGYVPFGNWTQSQLQPQCGDARGTMIGEYETRGEYPLPSCADFVNSGGTANFSWGELNDQWSGGNEGSHYPWGMDMSGTASALEIVRNIYDRGGIRLTSGYRCAQGNRNVGGVAGSYHIRARAADMKSAAHPWTEAEFALLKAATDLTNPTESFSWNTYPDDHHYHAAW